MNTCYSVSSATLRDFWVDVFSTSCHFSSLFMELKWKRKKNLTSFFHPSGSSLLSWNWKYEVTERLFVQTPPPVHLNKEARFLFMKFDSFLHHGIKINFRATIYTSRGNSITNEMLCNRLIGYSSFRRHNLCVLRCWTSFHSSQACHCTVISTQRSLKTMPSARPIPVIWKEPRPPTPAFIETELSRHKEI